MSLRDRVLEGVYAKLPRLDCKGQCQLSCGPIGMGPAEWARLTEFLGYAPGPEPGYLLELPCPLLGRDGRCTVYAIRPLVCRLFGMVEKMRCPWGCEPERWLSDEEARGLLRSLKTAS